VTVTGPPLAICCWKRGMTEPELPKTLPNRTDKNFVHGGRGICCRVKMDKVAK